MRRCLPIIGWAELWAWPYGLGLKIGQLFSPKLLTLLHSKEMLTEIVDGPDRLTDKRLLNPLAHTR